MILYHGSSIAVENPDLLHTRKRLDFGQGFYTTPFYEQAVSWSRRFLVKCGSAVVSSYDFEYVSNGWGILEFAEYGADWLNFIMDCRNGKPISENWDLIIGGVANDKVFDTV